MKALARLACSGLFVLHAICSSAQGWEKSYGGLKNDDAYDVIQTSDGGYVAVGSTASFGAGGTDMFIVKINSGGVLKWTRVIGGPGNETAYSVAEAASGDLIVAGLTGSYGAGGNDGYVARLTANGGLKWTHTYGGPGSDEFRQVELAGNNLVLAGSTTVSGNSDMYLVKTDGNGNLLWDKHYGLSGTEVAYGMTRTYDNGFALAGYTTSYGSNKVYLVRTNSTGDTLFTRNYYQGASSTGARGIDETTDHGLVMTGFFYTGSGYGDLFYMKISSTGATLVNATDNALANNGVNVCATGNGGFMLIADYCNFGCTLELMRYDGNGVSLWKKPGYQYANSYSYNTFSTAGRVKSINSNSALLACGSTYLPSGNNSDFLIIKADTSGNTGSAVTLTASGPTTFCAPGSVTLNAPAGYASYQWTYVSGGHAMTYISGANGTSYVASASGYYSCIMKSAANDMHIGQISVTATPNTGPSITPSGNTQICTAAGESVSLSASTLFGYTYQWKLNGSAIGGATTSGYVPPQSGSYTLTTSNACGTYTSAPVAVNLSAPPNAPAISGDLIMAVYCSGILTNLSGVLQVSPANVSYQWYHNGAAMNNATSYSVSPYYDHEDYTCVVSNACGSDTTAPYHVDHLINAFNPATPVAGGPTQGCGVSGVNLNMDPLYGYYEWYLNGVQIPGANQSTYTATATGSYTCLYQSPYCGLEMSDAIQVSISAQPAAAITAAGPTSFCSGSVTLNATPTGAGITYQWYKDNVSIPGATSSSYSATAKGSYHCAVTQPSCGLSMSGYIYVGVGLPASNLTANNTTICATGSSTISVVTQPPGQTYQWYRNGNLLAGAVSPSYVTSTQGSYTCQVTNGCGSTTTSSPVVLTVNPVPVPVVSGSNSLCPGGTVTINETSGTGNAYQWMNGNSNIGGAVNASYTASATGSYRVRVTNGFGCSTVSPYFVVTAGSVPVPAVTASAYPVICSNEQITLKATTGSGFTYKWKNNGVTIPGATDSVYTTSAPGTYSVAVTNTCGTATATLPYPVTTKSLPQATVTPQGPITFCAGGSVQLDATTGAGLTYEWKRNSNLINGAKSQSFIAKTAGTYKVIVTNNSGCKKSSSGVVVSVPCREGEEPPSQAGELSASAWPNPFTGTFTLYAQSNAERMHITVTDLSGRLVLEQDAFTNQEIQLGELLDPGCYMVRVATGTQLRVIKMVKSGL